MIEGALYYSANEQTFNISYTFMINGAGRNTRFWSTVLTTKSLLYTTTPHVGVGAGYRIVHGAMA